MTVGRRSGGPEILQNRANKWAGFFVSVGMVVLLFVSDPMRLWRPAADFEGSSEHPLPPDVLLFTGVLCLASLGALRLFWGTRVLVFDDRMSVENPLRRYRVDIPAITEVDLSGRFPSIIVDQRRIMLAGVEHSMAMSLQGERHRLTQALSRIDSEIGGGRDGGLVVTWRLPSRLEWAFVAFWGIAICVVVVRWLTAV